MHFARVVGDRNAAAHIKKVELAQKVNTLNQLWLFAQSLFKLSGCAHVQKNLAATSTGNTAESNVAT